MGIIEKLVGEDFTLVQDGSRFFRTVEHSSLVVDSQRDLFYWNSRRISGNPLQYLMLVRGYSYSTAKTLLKNLDSSIYVPPVIETKVEHCTSDVNLVDLFFDAGKTHRDYWYNKRGYTDDTINRFKLGYTGEWYTIPIFDAGKFVNFQVRKENPKVIKHWYRGIGPHPFNFSVLNFSSWIIIAEGPPDAIMLRQNNLPGISQTGGCSYWNKDWNSLFVSKRKIYIVYDNDIAGNINAKKLGEVFGKKAIVYTFAGYQDKYDITDYFNAGNTGDDFMELLETKGKYAYEI